MDDEVSHLQKKFQKLVSIYTDYYGHGLQSQFKKLARVAMCPLYCVLFDNVRHA